MGRERCSSCCDRTGDTDPPGPLRPGGIEAHLLRPGDSGHKKRRGFWWEKYQDPYTIVVTDDAGSSGGSAYADALYFHSWGFASKYGGGVSQTRPEEEGEAVVEDKARKCGAAYANSRENLPAAWRHEVDIMDPDVKKDVLMGTHYEDPVSESFGRNFGLGVEPDEPGWLLTGSRIVETTDGVKRIYFYHRECNRAGRKCQLWLKMFITYPESTGKEPSATFSVIPSVGPREIITSQDELNKKADKCW